ncbi:MAG: bifunctional 5,10-methylenetetrahydrofolate dehydrogenase/5,10-methenyltetrahydrofolate cyclohydrolase [Patescibacteria group bacterium]|jgi:methylenetetrahydrofolate dehydrogenase (NADP+)/methenyltetrahydrofolate cyclohydrolase
MSAQIIDGKKLADEILADVKQKVSKMSISPSLCVIRVEGDPASETYVRKKKEACFDLGIRFNDVVLPGSTTQEELIKTVEKYNLDEETSAIIVQLPLPESIDPKVITRAINPAKDVDGLNPVSDYIPATPRGIIKVLESIGFKYEGANAVVVGRSDLVGKPTAAELLKKDCTVTVCHSKTKDLAFHTRSADLVVVAVGKPRMLTVDMIKDGVVVIDVGINRIDGKLVGDVDFENVKEKAGFLTKVPGGVGPLTVACLLENVASV